MKYVMLIVLALSLGCAKNTVAVHPGAISNIDSYAYDVLLVEQDAINSARTAYTAGTLPPAAKGPLNSAIAQYNITESAWQAYHTAGGDATALQQALSALVGAVGALQQALGKAPVPVPTARQECPSENGQAMEWNDQYQRCVWYHAVPLSGGN